MASGQSSAITPGCTSASTVSTGSGTLTLTGDVTATNLLQATTIPVMQGNLALGAGAHNINVGTFPAAPGAVGMVLNSTLSGAGTISKIGAGVLGIGGNNAAFTNAVGVTAGSVQFTNLETSLGSTINLGASGTLNAGGLRGNIGGLTGTGTVTSTFSTLAQAGGQVSVGLGNVTSSSGAFITGVVTMAKIGSGDFSMTNTASDYTGGTLVNGGTLTLAGAGLNTSGSGLLSVNNTGTLQGSGSVNGGLRFNSGSAVNFTLGAVPGPAPIDSLASVSSLGQARVNIAGTPAAGRAPLVCRGCADTRCRCEIAGSSSTSATSRARFTSNCVNRSARGGSAAGANIEARTRTARSSGRAR